MNMIHGVVKIVLMIAAQIFIDAMIAMMVF